MCYNFIISHWHIFRPFRNMTDLQFLKYIILNFSFYCKGRKYISISSVPYYQQNCVVERPWGRLHFEGQKILVVCKLGSADKIVQNRAVSNNNFKPLLEDRNTFMKHETCEIWSLLSAGLPTSFKLFKPCVAFMFSKIIDLSEINQKAVSASLYRKRRRQRYAPRTYI
jgi:hypothetical protein